MSREHARAELERNSGTQFWPAGVANALTILGESPAARAERTTRQRAPKPRAWRQAA